MSASSSDLLHVLKTRGFIQDLTDEEGIVEALKEGPVSGYIGFDLTGRSLHVGSLVQIMILRWMQRCGHRPIVLMGGGTTRIGDPSGKDESRPLLDEASIRANMAGIRKVFDTFLTFGEGPSDAVMLDNYDWLKDLNYIGFLRDYGPHFTVNRMLTFDSVKLRLEREQPLTFLEFNYMLFQAYDFLELYRRETCRIQFGGSDQWGNIINGIELGRRIEGAQLFGITTPLVTTADGKKMGKTAAGAVWLDGDMLSPYDYWQFWRNTADADVGRFLRLFTEIPLRDVAEMEALEGAEVNEAKKILATAATAMIHGHEEADKAWRTASETFAGSGVSADLPTVEVPSADLSAGIQAYALFHRAGLSASGSEARRLIKGSGARVNDAPIEDDTKMIGLADVTGDGVIKLSAGKKKHVLIKPAP
ncbi:MAG: tyrosine--tRNA ligase [Alphaproteobacteria bacterium]